MSLYFWQKSVNHLFFYLTIKIAPQSLFLCGEFFAIFSSALSSFVTSLSCQGAIFIACPTPGQCALPRRRITFHAKKCHFTQIRWFQPVRCDKMYMLQCSVYAIPLLIHRNIFTLFLLLFLSFVSLFHLHGIVYFFIWKEAGLNYHSLLQKL